MQKIKFRITTMDYSEVIIYDSGLLKGPHKNLLLGSTIVMGQADRT